MVFFHYCVMSNYFWLFIEGLYLFTLLVETFFPERRYFYWYTIVGWGEYVAIPKHDLTNERYITNIQFLFSLLIIVVTGTPTICVTVWAVLRLHFHDTGYVSNHLWKFGQYFYLRNFSVFPATSYTNSTTVQRQNVLFLSLHLFLSFSSVNLVTFQTLNKQQ